MISKHKIWEIDFFIGAKSGGGEGKKGNKRKGNERKEEEERKT